MENNFAISADGVLEKYTGKESSVVIPKGVTEIGDYAFWCCRSLQHITIPGSVSEIGGGAFDGCTDLQSIKLPNSVTYIGCHAFGDAEVRRV